LSIRSAKHVRAWVEGWVFLAIPFLLP
jgi:hypothetical protein